MSLQSELTLAHATCPCIEEPWAKTKCRNCAAQRGHSLDDCEWRGHAAIRRLVQIARLNSLEEIKTIVDRDVAISAEVRKVLQGAA